MTIAISCKKWVAVEPVAFTFFHRLHSLLAITIGRRVAGVAHPVTVTLVFSIVCFELPRESQAFALTGTRATFSKTSRCD